MFENVTWPSTMVYNIATEQGVKISCSAEVEVIKEELSPLDYSFSEIVTLESSLRYAEVEA